MESSSGEEHFSGYGNKHSLTRSEINVAIKRINSYHGVNFIVSAPGKLILFGEHAVVYGKSALAMSIDKRTYLRITENKVHDIFVICMRDINFSYHVSFDKIIKFINEDIPGNDLKPLSKPIHDCYQINHNKFLEIIKDNFINNIKPVEANIKQTISFCAFLYLLHVIFYKENYDNDVLNSRLLSPMVIDISSELTLGSGMGSSASFCVCIATALLHYRNIKIHGYDLAKEMTFSEEGLELISKFAFNAEKIMHGLPSGIDTTVCTYGSFIEVKNIDSKRKFIDLPDSPKLHIILIDSGIKRNTIEVINDVARRYNLNSEPIEHIFNSIHEVSEKASHLIKKIGQSQANGSLDLLDYKQLAELVNINQGLLYSLGVSHKCLQDICSICMDYGLSVKLTGAGCGGCAIIFVSPEFDKNLLLNCIHKLKDSNYKLWDVELDVDGVRLEDLRQFKRS